MIPNEKPASSTQGELAVKDARIVELEAALQFYADLKSWTHGCWPEDPEEVVEGMICIDWQQEDEHAIPFADCGDRARRALSGSALSALDRTTLPPAEGMVLVPTRFRIDATSIANLVFQCGADEHNTEFFDAIAWVGELEGEDDEPVTYGIHAYSTEYPEDGSVTLATLPAPQGSLP